MSGGLSAKINMKIIVGLGNPGKKYKITRHNVGFMVVDALADQKSLSWQYNKKFKSTICKDKDIILVKPQTFMNNSGQAIQAILSYYKLLPKRFGLIQKKDINLSSVLMVIHDDIDIELGKYKISENSRSAGHKGVASIINCLKTKNFKRIRTGIRTERANTIPAEKFVLQNFSESELTIIDKLITELINTLKI
jgi:PTH1 family peptidyl-tRNA hydrolase